MACVGECVMDKSVQWCGLFSGCIRPLVESSLAASWLFRWLYKHLNLKLY
jgi:hypothetical protein